MAALLDPGRLRIAGALVGVHLTTDDLVELTGLDRRDVLEAIGTLRQAGLADSAEGTHTVPIERLRALAAAQSPVPEPMDASIGVGMLDHERDVLSRFFEGHTLTEIPTTWSKRIVVLQRLALEFEIGRRHPESEVNDILRAFHSDVAALRRHLVDEGFLDRERGEYWRSGGRTDPVSDQD